MASAPNVPFKLPPGVVRGASDAEVAGRWYDAHLMRWVNGVARPVPGWDRIDSSVVVGSPIRAVRPWIANNGVEYVGILCESHAYVYKDGDYYDITPTGGMAGPGASPLIGGYGTHNYNLNNYGDPRPDISDVNIAGPVWSISNWGEDLVFQTSFDQRLLRWKPSTPTTKASAVPGAPTGRFFVVTPQRHVVMFGLNSMFNRWGWCDQEDIEDWNFTDPLNTAGDFTISPASRIVSGIALKSGVLFFTTKHAYFASYLGVPYIYGYERVGSNMTPISPQLIAEYSDKAGWLAHNGFWSFDSAAPTFVESTLFDYFKDKSDPLYTKFKGFAVDVGIAPELWFFFPSAGKPENDQYVSWNYTTGEWSKGFVSRTCGTPPDNTSYPIMSDGQFIYYHERGRYYGSVPLPYLESASVNLKSGMTMSTIIQMLADHSAPPNAVWYTLFGRIPRLSKGSPAEKTSRRQAKPDGYIDFRMTARDFRIRIEQADNGGPLWTVGQMPINMKARGGR